MYSAMPERRKELPGWINCKIKGPCKYQQTQFSAQETFIDQILYNTFDGGSICCCIHILYYVDSFSVLAATQEK